MKTSDRNSIRTSGSAGIRFGGFVPAATLSDADEVGFLVARGDLLADKGLTPADEIQVSGTVTEKTDGAFTARAYVKIGSLYFYGDCSTKSVKEVAESIKKAGGAAYTANSEYIDNIIESAGKTVTE